jgi:hypothetical protein
LFKSLRIAILITILVVVVAGQWLKEARLADWKDPIWITVYPLVADGRQETLSYVRSLDNSRFQDIGEFLKREGRRYGQSLHNPVLIQLAAPVRTLPPPLPTGNNGLSIGIWSLKMRWWAWRRQREDGLPEPDVQVFVQYRGEQGQPALDRSVGLRKGMYALVNAYSSTAMASRNRVVIAHELMHILGASDKYDPATSLPLHPDGYAQPNRTPLYPQKLAEIMGGRIALSPDNARIPASLEYCVVGLETAREIGWQ